MTGNRLEDMSLPPLMPMLHFRISGRKLLCDLLLCLRDVYYFRTKWASVETDKIFIEELTILVYNILPFLAIFFYMEVPSEYISI